MNESTNDTTSSSNGVWTAVSQKLQNGSGNDNMNSKSIDFHSHNSFIAVIIIMSLFLVVTISTTGLVLAFCRKKNTVFVLQKCEQESEYELDDMDKTDTEICEDEFSTTKQTTRSSTFPCFTNIKSSEYPSSPSRTPLVNKNSQFYNSNSDDTVIGESIDQNGIIRHIHRSHTVAIFPNTTSSKYKHNERTTTKDMNCTTALISTEERNSNSSISISMEDTTDHFGMQEGTLEFLDIHTISKEEDGEFINV